MPHGHALWSTLTLLLLRGQNDSQASKHSCVFFSFAFSSLCWRVPVSSELWSRASACNPSRFTFHPSKLVMGNFVHFRYLLYVVSSFLGLFLPDSPLPFHPLFNNLYKWQITFLFWAAALPLYFVVWRASFFHFLPFFFLLSTLTEQCKCLKMQQHFCFDQIIHPVARTCSCWTEHT